MTKFDQVLSNDELLEVFVSKKEGSGDYNALDVMRWAQEAVLAKLHEQEPAAWLHPEDPTRSVTKWQKDGAIKDGGAIEKTMSVFSVPAYARPIPTTQEPIGYLHANEVSFLSAKGVTTEQAQAEDYNIPLYDHPMPCVSPTSDKTACVSESGGDDNRINALSDGTPKDEGAIKHLSYLKRYQKWRRGEDKTMSEMGLTPKQIGEALDWLIGVAENHIADASKMVCSDHIADMRKKVPEGWQLIPKEPAEEMHHAARDWSVEKYGKAIGYEASHGCYQAMLAAAPKHKGSNDD